MLLYNSHVKFELLNYSFEFRELLISSLHLFFIYLNQHNI